MKAYLAEETHLSTVFSSAFLSDFILRPSFTGTLHGETAVLLSEATEAADTTVSTSEIILSSPPLKHGSKFTAMTNSGIRILGGPYDVVLHSDSTV